MRGPYGADAVGWVLVCGRDYVVFNVKIAELEGQLQIFINQVRHPAMSPAQLGVPRGAAGARAC